MKLDGLMNIHLNISKVFVPSATQKLYEIVRNFYFEPIPMALNVLQVYIFVPTPFRTLPIENDTLSHAVDLLHSNLWFISLLVFRCKV